MRTRIVLTQVSREGSLLTGQEDGNEGARRQNILICQPFVDGVCCWKQCWHQVLVILSKLAVWLFHHLHFQANRTGRAKWNHGGQGSFGRHGSTIGGEWRGWGLNPCVLYIAYTVHCMYIIVHVCVHDNSHLSHLKSCIFCHIVWVQSTQMYMHLRYVIPHACVYMYTLPVWLWCHAYFGISLLFCILKFHSRFCFKCGHVVSVLSVTTWVTSSYLLWVYILTLFYQL